MQRILAALILCAVSAPTKPALLKGVVDIPAGRDASAIVTLHIAYPGRSRLLIDGFAQRSAAKGPSVETQPGGRFELRVAAKGRYFVRAQADGCAPCEIGPLELDPAQPIAEVRLALSDGAAIQGRVVPAREGGRVEGLWVCASRGDGFPLSARTDGKGEYRFERVVPGRWHVRLQRQPASEQTGGIETTAAASDEIPWNVEARASEAARFDIEFARRPVLDGRLAFAHRPAAQWRAILRSDGVSPSIDEVRVDASGAFRLDGEGAGTYTLKISGKLEGLDVRLDQPLTLAEGETPWERDFALGSLAGHRADASVKLVRCVLAGEDGLSGAVSATPDAQGLFAVPKLPVGAWRLVQPTFAGDHELGHVTVEADKEAWIELP